MRFFRSALLGILCMGTSILVFGEGNLNILSGTMAEMTWQEVQAAGQSHMVVLLPVGVIEEHGPHLDLSIDAYLAADACLKIQGKLDQQGLSTIIAPPYYYRINKASAAFPGSFSVSESTFKAILADTITCLHAWGFSAVFIVNVHGDSTHRRVLTETSAELTKSLGMPVYSLTELRQSVDVPVPMPPPRSSRLGKDIHAGSLETAWVYALYPEKVRVEIARKLAPQQSFSDPLGYVGDPASFEKEDLSVFMDQWNTYYARQLLVALGKVRK
jgi:creatinine amidohydrolase